VIGPGRLRALHLNDSKTDLGSHVDRHERLGRGRIGPAPFRWIARARRFAGLPAVVETPIGAKQTYRNEIAALRAWRDE
jgi:endonuclease IV